MRHAEGQTAVEYLLTVAGVFLALWGIRALLDPQGDRYLDLLSRCLRFPF